MARHFLSLRSVVATAAVATLLAGLVGCTAPAALREAALRESAVVDISVAQLPEYWIAKRESVQFRTPVARTWAHVVIVEYVIDPWGRVQQARVASSEPANGDTRWALEAVRRYSYAPAPGNVARTPVRLRTSATLGKAR